MMNLMLLTADPKMAKRAEDCGVDRIFVDLEYINKMERQKGRNTFISDNTVENVKPVRDVIAKSKLLVRVNPINPLTQTEIDRVIEDGADIVMLPMAYDAHDVEKFIRFVDGRAYTLPMIETAQAMTRIDDIMDVDGVDELFIGLNDLHISLGLSFLFESLAGGLVDYMAEKLNRKGIPFGFGGIAKIGEGILPAEDVLAEHYRLGSSSVILSRTFRNEVDAEGKKILDLQTEVDKIRRAEREIQQWDKARFERNRRQVHNIVRQIVSQM